MSGVIATTDFLMSLLIAFLAVVLPGVMAYIYWTLGKEEEEKTA